MCRKILTVAHTPINKIPNTKASNCIGQFHWRSRQSKSIWVFGNWLFSKASEPHQWTWGAGKERGRSTAAGKERERRYWGWGSCARCRRCPALSLQNDSLPLPGKGLGPQSHQACHRPQRPWFCYFWKREWSWVWGLGRGGEDDGGGEEGRRDERWVPWELASESRVWIWRFCATLIVRSWLYPLIFLIGSSSP